MFGCVFYVQCVCVGGMVCIGCRLGVDVGVRVWVRQACVWMHVLENLFCVFLCMECGNVGWHCVCVWGGEMLDVCVRCRELE